MNPRPLPEVMRISQARLTAGLDRYARIDLDAHQQIFGAMRRMNARQLIEMVERVDLRGRGGAAFPFARKIRAVMDSATARGRNTAHARVALILSKVANAEEATALAREAARRLGVDSTQLWIEAQQLQGAVGPLLEPVGAAGRRGRRHCRRGRCPGRR